MGDEFEVLVSEEVRSTIEGLDDKSTRIVKDNLGKLTNPYPGEVSGDKEQITWRGNQVHRLHIGRTWTAFYDIHESEGVVNVLDLMPIDQAHKEYGEI